MENYNASHHDLNVLVIDNDPVYYEAINESLTQSQIHVERLTASEDLVYKLGQHSFGLVILDPSVSHPAGQNILATLKKNYPHLPVIIVTSKDTLQGKLQYFEEGCDDYLSKPFYVEELTARAKALMRRAPMRRSMAFVHQDLTLDVTKAVVLKSGEEINLTRREFSILEYLMRNHNQVMTRGNLLSDIWGYNFDPNTNVVDVHIKSLRAKLTNNSSAPYLTIKTVRGRGYIFNGDVQQSFDL